MRKEIEMLKSRQLDRRGFTLIEIVIAVAIVAIFAAAISPMVFRHLEDAKITRAKSETETISTAILSYYKDTGRWPFTNANGPAGNTIDRVVSASNVSTIVGTGAGPGATNWGTYGTVKNLGDYLYFNNPDDDSSATGLNADEAGQDWASTGTSAWKGPYLDNYDLTDPWGNAYVISSRYFPGGHYTGTIRHKALVLSPGPDGSWQTSYADATTEDILGDDIGTVVTVR